MSEVTLYHAPPSFYSQIARIALAEKGIRWKTGRMGPFSNYDPWYMRLNPGGTIPTMVHDGHVVPDSFAIARYVDAHFEGPPLTPADENERAAMERWIDKLGAISLRELSYGSEKIARFGARANALRIRILKRRQRQNPEMAALYREKQQDIEGFSKNALDSAHVARIREQVRTACDEMEEALGKNPWLCGVQYSLADAFWTVALARFLVLKIDPFAGRPNLADWYAKVKVRPSFRTADIWETISFFRMLPMILQKFGPRLALIAAAIAALWVALAWLL